MAKLLLGGCMFKNLLSIREENELTQVQVARVCGVNKSNISKWENNKEIIPMEHLNEYSNFFNVSFDYLAGFTNIKSYEVINRDFDLVLIGSRLNKFRKYKGLTLKELASILNTSPSTLSAYENGKVLMLTSFAYEICRRYNISMDWLLGKTKDFMFENDLVSL